MQKVMHLFTILVVLSVGVCVTWLQPFPILHDFPEWMYQGWIAHQLFFLPGGVVADQFVLTDYPVPNSVSQIAMALLNMFVSPVMAGKIWLGIYLLYSSILCFLLSRHFPNKQSGSINLILIMTFVLGPGFWNGYANFQFALLFFATSVLLMRLQRCGVLLHLVLSLVIFFSHASVYLVFVLLVVARVVYAHSSVRNLVAVMPSLVLLIWYSIKTVQIDALGVLRAPSLMEWFQYKVYSVAKQGYFHNFILSDGSSLLDRAHIVYLGGMVLNLLLAVVIVVYLTLQSWRWLRSWVDTGYAGSQSIGSEYRREYQVQFAVVLLVMALFLIAGKNNLGVVNLGERFFIAGLLLAMVNLHYPPMLVRIWAIGAFVGAVYIITVSCVVSSLPVQKYAVERSTAAKTLDGAIDDIYANSRHKYFNHRLYIYADHGLWLMAPSGDLQPFKHHTSIVKPR